MYANATAHFDIFHGNVHIYCKDRFISGIIWPCDYFGWGDGLGRRKDGEGRQESK